MGLSSVYVDFRAPLDGRVDGIRLYYPCSCDHDTKSTICFASQIEKLSAVQVIGHLIRKDFQGRTILENLPALLHHPIIKFNSTQIITRKPSRRSHAWCVNQQET